MFDIWFSFSRRHTGWLHNWDCISCETNSMLSANFGGGVNDPNSPINCTDLWWVEVAAKAYTHIQLADFCGSASWNGTGIEAGYEPHQPHRTHTPMFGPVLAWPLVLFWRGVWSCFGVVLWSYFGVVFGPVLAWSLILFWRGLWSFFDLFWRGVWFCFGRVIPVWYRVVDLWYRVVCCLCIMYTSSCII